MTTPELASYVRKRLKKGYPAGELRHELLRQGYAEQVVQDAFTPRRQWSDPHEGFGVQQLWGSVIFLCAGTGRLGINHLWQFGSGMAATCICVVLLYLYWRYGRPSSSGMSRSGT